MGETSEVHKLLNKEGTNRGLVYARWNQNLWHGCKRHSNYMLKTGKFVHAPIGVIPSGGECIWNTKGNYAPKTIVESWMKSPGHKALILSHNIRSHAVAISEGKNGVYATWRGSFKATKQLKPIRFNSSNFFKIILNIILGFIGLLGIALGAHGIYVYFNKFDALFGSGSKFLLMIDVPKELSGLVLWATARGLQSWFIPALILIIGILILNYSHLWSVINRFFNKI